MTTQIEILERVLKDLRYYQQYGAKVILETAIFDLEHVIKEPPASKPWMWLTEEQKAELVFELFNDGKAASKAMYLLTAHEAKLKEKNGF